MSKPKGLFVPLNVIQGETLDFGIDIHLDGEILDPSTLTFTGAYARRNPPCQMDPIKFDFADDPIEPYIKRVQIKSGDTRILEPVMYDYEIKFTNPDTSATKTILYGSLSVSPSFI